MRPHIPIEGFNKRLEECLFENELNFGDICKKAGITRMQLWKYRFDGCMPSVQALKGLAIALNVSADYLLGITKAKEIRK